MPNENQLRAEIERLVDDPRPMHAIISGHEREQGYRIVKPGSEPWLRAEDWHYSSVVSVDDKRREVRLVAILAINPGTGTLRRTLGLIEAAGLKPVIVEPIFQLERSLRLRWGWQRRIVGSGFHREEQWRPKKGKGRVQDLR